MPENLKEKREDISTIVKMAMDLPDLQRKMLLAYEHGLMANVPNDSEAE